MLTDIRKTLFESMLPKVEGKFNPFVLYILKPKYCPYVAKELMPGSYKGLMPGSCVGIV